MLTATGLGSGLDVSTLVSQLVANERSGSDLQLNRQSAKLNLKLSALGSLKGVLSGFQASIGNLQNLNNFNQKTASSSDATMLTATATKNAISNNYALEVTQLSGSHSLASATFVDSNTTPVGTGTLTIRHGTTDYVPGSDTYNSFSLNPDSTASTIIIDSSNNTLEGVMAAINDADIDVSAAIVNDGSGFRLLLTSDLNGEENSLEITVADDDTNDADTSGLSRLAFNSSATNLEQTAEGKDALFTINGLNVSSASNTVDSAIPGVVIELKQTTTDAVNLSVGADFNSVLGSVGSFISGYNQYINTSNSLSSYDAENDIPSALLGDFTLRAIEGQINNILRNAVTGLSGSITNLAELGITTTESGTLLLDPEALNSALANDPVIVARMFAAIGTASDEEISYNASSIATVIGDYVVDITTLASSGVLDSASVLPDFGSGGTVVIDSDNNNLTIEIDGIDAGEITLTAGTYSAGADLAAELQVQINSSTALQDVSKTVTVAYNSGSNSFSITSDSLGSESTVNVLAIDTNSAADIGFSVNSGTVGDDVVGSIGGVAGTGVGNTLSGAEGSDTEGLTLTIAGTTTGNRGTFSFTRGLTSQLDVLFENLLDEEGALESRLDTFQDRIDDVADRRAQLELKWEAVEERYSRQFNALDRLLAGLESTSTFLQGQLDNLLKPFAANRN